MGKAVLLDNTRLLLGSCPTCRGQNGSMDDDDDDEDEEAAAAAAVAALVQAGNKKRSRISPPRADSN